MPIYRSLTKTTYVYISLYMWILPFVHVENNRTSTLYLKQYVMGEILLFRTVKAFKATKNSLLPLIWRLFILSISKLQYLRTKQSLPVLVQYHVLRLRFKAE